jgi:hypothetical protein
LIGVLASEENYQGPPNLSIALLLVAPTFLAAVLAAWAGMRFRYGRRDGARAGQRDVRAR